MGARLQGLTTENKPTKQVAVKKEVNSGKNFYILYSFRTKNNTVPFNRIGNFYTIKIFRSFFALAIKV